MFLSYAGFENFSHFFDLIQIACDQGKNDEVLLFFPEALRILAFLHERILRHFGKDIVNLFKPDPNLFQSSDELLQSRSLTHKNCNSAEEETKVVFDKEKYIKSFEDEMQSKFTMYSAIESLFKPEACILTLKDLFEKKNIRKFPQN